MRAIFYRKEPGIRADEFAVRKVVTLPVAQYEHFAGNLLQEYDFIRENAHLMGERDGVRQCILVTGEGLEEGVLVESEGASYARYAAFVPCTGEIIRQYDAMYTDWKEQCGGIFKPDDAAQESQKQEQQKESYSQQMA